MARFLIQCIVLLLFLVLTVNSFLAIGQDFGVFWRAGRNVLEGLPVYDAARDGAWSFKYPPWIATLFVPLGTLPERAAGVAWRLLQVASLAWIFDHVRRRLQNPVAAMLPLLSMWGIWQFCILQGQITLFLLALSVWGLSGSSTSGRLTSAFWALTAKTFHSWVLLAGPRIRLRSAGTVGAISLLLALPVLHAYPRVEACWDAYRAAAISHQANLGGAFTGFPALMVRASRLPESELLWHSVASAVLILLFLGVAWAIRSRIPRGHERLFVALGWGAALHPLSFAYGFAFAYPLAAIATDRAFQPGTSIVDRGVAVLGVVFLNLVSSTTLGAAGGWLADQSIRAWGVALLSWVLLRDPLAAASASDRRARSI